MTPAKGASFRSRALESTQRLGEQNRNAEIHPPTTQRFAPDERRKYQLWPTPESDSEVTALPALRRKRSTTIPRTAGSATLARSQVNDFSWPLHPDGSKQEQGIMRNAPLRIQPGEYLWFIKVAFH